MVQWSRILAALSEDPSSIPNPHDGWLTFSCTSRSVRSYTLFWIPMAWFTRKHTHNWVSSDTHVVEEENRLLQVVLWSPLCTSLTTMNKWNFAIQLYLKEQCSFLSCSLLTVFTSFDRGEVSEDKSCIVPITMITDAMNFSMQRPHLGQKSADHKNFQLPLWLTFFAYLFQCCCSLIHAEVM